jgi:hypothetical protein
MMVNHIKRNPSELKRTSTDRSLRQQMGYSASGTSAAYTGLHQAALPPPTASAVRTSAYSVSCMRMWYTMAAPRMMATLKAHATSMARRPRYACTLPLKSLCPAARPRSTTIRHVTQDSAPSAPVMARPEAMPACIMPKGSARMVVPIMVLTMEATVCRRDWYCCCGAGGGCARSNSSEE